MQNDSPAMNSAYIDVILNVPLNQTFTYKIPEGTQNIENPFGLRVEVKFGNRKTSGFVAAVHKTLPQNCAVSEEKIRTAIRYIDQIPLLTKELLELAEFMSGYYIASIGECVFAMIPSGKRETEIPGLSFSEDESGFKRKDLSEEQKNAVNGILSSTEKFHYLY